MLCWTTQFIPIRKLVQHVVKVSFPKLKVCVIVLFWRKHPDSTVMPVLTLNKKIYPHLAVWKIYMGGMDVH